MARSQPVNVHLHGVLSCPELREPHLQSWTGVQISPIFGLCPFGLELG